MQPTSELKQTVLAVGVLGHLLLQTHVIAMGRSLILHSSTSTALGCSVTTLTQSWFKPQADCTAYLRTSRGKSSRHAAAVFSSAPVYSHQLSQDEPLDWISWRRG